jgi:hypothetical protein
MRTGFELEKAQYPSIQGGLTRGPLLLGSFTDLLVGGPGSVDACSNCTRTASGDIVHGYLESNVSAYFQDDWKVNAKLTVNLGVRWEYDGTFSDKYGSLSNTWLSLLVPNSQVPTGPNQGPANLGGWVVPNNYLAHYPQPPVGVLINPSGNGALRDHPPLSNFGPRIGFAYQLTSKLVVRGGAGIFYDRVGAGLFFHSVEQGNPYAESTVYAPPANATYTLANPYPAQPVAGTFAQRWANFATGQTSALSLPFYNEDSHTPLVRQYNLTFQYEFAPRWILEAGYVGSNAINLVDSGHNYNTALIATPTDPINGITTTTVANAPFRVPYVGYQAAGLQGTAYDGVASYNSLQVTVRKQLSYGLSLQGSYTWSKSLTDLFNSVANSNNASNLAQQYGPSNFNRPQRFILNYSWALPFGKHNGVTGKLLGGWNLSGVTTIQDGTQVSLIDNRGGTAYGVSGTSASGGYSRAQLCPGQTYADIATPGGIESRLGGNSGGPGYFNKAAFCTPPAFNPDGSLTTAAACPTCAIGYGNTGAGILMGPGQFNFDAALLKTTNLTERQSVQFRAEFFNLFNHPQFNGPAQVLLGTQGLPNVNSPTGSWITSTSVNPRVIQLGLKYIF